MGFPGGGVNFHPGGIPPNWWSVAMVMRIPGVAAGRTTGPLVLPRSPRQATASTARTPATTHDRPTRTTAGPSYYCGPDGVQAGAPRLHAPLTRGRARATARATGDRPARPPEV